MRTPHSCGMETNLSFKTSHPLLFQREWKMLRWVVWKEREFTFGQANVSSPERKGAELSWELVVPEGGKEYWGNEVSSGRPAQVCVPGRKTARGAVAVVRAAAGCPQALWDPFQCLFPFIQAQRSCTCHSQGRSQYALLIKCSEKPLEVLRAGQNLRTLHSPTSHHLHSVSLVQTAASTGTGRNADVSPPSVDFSLGEFLHYLHESQN